MYDYLIVGSGLYGSICTHELTKKGYKCLVIEKRDHIGGNCYTSNRDGINVHEYGPHIFHTSNDRIWEYINRFVKFNNFTFRPVANYKDSIYSLPFNMWTFSKLWNISIPEEAKQIIKAQSSVVSGEPKNLEQQAIKLLGTDVYRILIRGYTEKQWRKKCSELPPEIIKRLPVRFTYDNNYFNDKYQGIPIGGYTQIFEKLLNGIDLRLNTDYLSDKYYYNSLADKVIYTGAIDAYYEYQFGELEYKTTRFNHRRLEVENYQGTAVMNFTDLYTPYTRIIEHKHFEFGDQPYTWITYEYPVEYKAEETEPYYPVNDKINNDNYSKYKALADKEPNIFFGGRLAEYKYYDMHQVIESALNFCDKI
jgi:UDP-galactopyranose mutase